MITVSPLLAELTAACTATELHVEALMVFARATQANKGLSRSAHNGNSDLMNLAIGTGP